MGNGLDANRRRSLHRPLSNDFKLPENRERNMKRDIQFISQGLSCAGWFYLPDRSDDRGKYPAIVMAHGFSATKEMCLSNFAERFVEAGFAVLVFDYRYMGESEGKPRSQLFPHQQHQDYRNGISWVRQQPEIDPDWVGVWGSSYSGGHVLHLAATDRRIKAVVAQVPLVNGYANAQRLLRPDQLAAFQRDLAADREQRYTTGNINYAKVVAPEGKPSVLPTPDSYEWFISTSERLAPNWRNQVSLESLDYFLEYNPAANIQLISPTPLLMVVAENDHVTPTDLAITAYERALEPKKLVIIRGRHFDAYTGAGLEQSATPAVEWFKQHLKHGASV
jgi:uncharacterized protein